MKKILLAAMAVLSIASVAEAGARREHWRFDSDEPSASVWFVKPGGSMKVICAAHLLHVTVRRTAPLGAGDETGRPVFFTIDGERFPDLLWHNEGNVATLTAQEPVDTLVSALEMGRRAQISLIGKDNVQSHHEVSLNGSRRAIGQVRAACAAT